MDLARVDGDQARRQGVKYDVRVVAALALCVLALPPVVNAIMAQAAEQADTSWLRDADFDGDPEIDDPPPVQLQPGDQPPPDQEPPTPPEDRERPEPVCEPFTEGRSRTLTDVSEPTGVLPLQLRGDDRGVQAEIQGTGVTGSPDFVLAVDGQTVWEYHDSNLGGSVNEAPQEPEMELARAPESWTLTYDLSGVVYQSFELSLVTLRCEVPR